MTNGENTFLIWYFLRFFHIPASDCTTRIKLIDFLFRSEILIPVTVVYEMVERKLDSITDTVPLLFAPQAENISGARLRNDGKNKILVRNDSGALKVYGILDKAKLYDDSRIYVSVKLDGNEKLFEAFPVTETELLKTEEKSDYGFSALIEGLGDKSEKAEVTVIVK